MAFNANLDVCMSAKQTPQALVELTALNPSH